MATKLRVGVIGTGFGSTVQIPAFRANPRVEVVAVASGQPGKARSEDQRLLTGRGRFVENALAGPLFVVSAIVSGLALVVVAAWATRRILGVGIKDELFAKLGRFLVWLLPIDFYFAFAEILTVQYGRMPAEFTTLQYVVFGPLAWSFWTEMIVGLLIPFLLIVRAKDRTPQRVGLAALLIFIGVFFKRIDIVIPSLIFRWLPFPAGGYAPTWVELSLMAAVYAFGILFFVTFAKLFPLVPLEKEREKEREAGEEAPRGVGTAATKG